MIEKLGARSFLRSFWPKDQECGMQKQMPVSIFVVRSFSDGWLLSTQATTAMDYCTRSHACTGRKKGDKTRIHSTVTRREGLKKVLRWKNSRQVEFRNLSEVIYQKKGWGGGASAIRENLMHAANRKQPGIDSQALLRRQIGGASSLDRRRAGAVLRGQRAPRPERAGSFEGRPERANNTTRA